MPNENLHAEYLYLRETFLFRIYISVSLENYLALVLFRQTDTSRYIVSQEAELDQKSCLSGNRRKFQTRQGLR